MLTRNCLVSMTRLRLRSPLLLPIFLWHNERIVQQIKQAPGFIEGKIMAALDLSMWTITIWDSDASLCRFYQQGSHGRATGYRQHWASEAVIGRYPLSRDACPSQAVELPSWSDVAQLLTQTGSFSNVQHPSRDQLQRFVPPPNRVLVTRTLHSQHSDSC